jgi:hypothetical protein
MRAMWRFLAGVGSALLLVTAGVFIWRGHADAVLAVPPAPAAADAGEAPVTEADYALPVAATERTREQKRFDRYDHDKNGAVTRDEYLANRRKAFAKLDTNGDGKLGFEEYVVKTALKFSTADHDRNATLTRAEFATTRVVRKTKKKPNCPQVFRAPETAQEPVEG